MFGKLDAQTYSKWNQVGKTMKVTTDVTIFPSFPNFLGWWTILSFQLVIKTYFPIE